MASIPCFLLTPTNRCRVSLRRYVSAASPERTCPGPFGYCNAAVVVGDEDYAEDHNGRADVPDAALRADPRWPAACAHCGRAFGDDAKWQVSRDRLHARSDGGPPCTLRDAPPGAMWDAPWYGDTKGPDGRALVVKTPGGEWFVDGPSYHDNGSVQSERGWTRTGEVPRITARPSILMHRSGYHAFLTDGVLVSC